MRPANFDIQVIIDDLNGTTNSIVGALADNYPEMDEADLTGSDYNAIDDQIFECSICNWWCETSESNESRTGDGDVCDDCNEEE